MISFKPPCLAEELYQADGKSQCHFGLLNVNAFSIWYLVIVFCCHENEVGTRVVPFRLRVEMLVM